MAVTSRRKPGKLKLKSYYYFGFVLLLLTFSFLSFDSYFRKTEVLESLDNLKYHTGTFEYYQSRPSPIDEPNEIRKMLLIKLQEFDYTFKDGLFFLAGLDKEKFKKQITKGATMTLGYIDSDSSNRKRLYDIQINGQGLVDFKVIKSRLQLEQLAGILLGLGFGIYAFYLIIKKAR